MGLIRDRRSINYREGVDDKGCVCPAPGHFSGVLAEETLGFWQEDEYLIGKQAEEHIPLWSNLARPQELG